MSYIPLKKLSLEDVVLDTTRLLVVAIQKVDDVKGDEVSDTTFNKVHDAIFNIIGDFQAYLGTTDGDKATHWFSDTQICPLVQCSRHDNIHDQLNDARHLLGTDGVYVQISSALKTWLDHLVNYGNSCYDSLDNYTCGNSCFFMHDNNHPFPEHRRLLEMNLGLVAVPRALPPFLPLPPDDEDSNYMYTLPDARGDEYGRWVFVPASRMDLGRTLGKPTKLEDGTYEKDEDGKIIYKNPETFERFVDVVEVTKYRDDGAIGFDIPLGQFRSFFYEIANLCVKTK